MASEPVSFPAAGQPNPTDDEMFSNFNLRGGDGSHNVNGSRSQARSRRRRDSTASASPQPNGQSSSEFQPGAIVRVKLKNFVTYNEAEFFLGPSLNMVIGPNGTGKSSLVCAICLGLGFPSNVLGRATAYGEYVKHGTDEATIEVELQGEPGEDNYVVGLLITRETNSREFTINGRKTTHKEVHQLMSRLRIQIDNLCQFLPQEKVAEFAGLTPVELLEKTLQAAAPEEMIAWQSELKDHYKVQAEAQRSADEGGKEIKRLEERQAALQADVERLREKEQYETAIAKLKKLKLVVAYNEARAQVSEEKKKKKDAERRLSRLQKDSAPSLEAVNRKQKYVEGVKAAVETRTAKLRDAEKDADNAVRGIEAAESKVRNLAGQLEAEQGAFAARRQELGKIRKKITELEAKHRQNPREFDPAEWNRRIREQEHKIRDKDQEVAELNEKLTTLRIEGKEKQKTQRTAQAKIDALDSHQGQLLSQLQQTDRDVAQAWEWLQKNQNLFEKEVFGPPMLTCSVKDPRYSDLVQAFLQRDDFLCFTAQTKKDHSTLSTQLYDVMRLSATVRTCFKDTNSFRRPMSQAELNALGLDGFVLDFLEGPDRVLAMLCSEKFLHRLAIALDDISEEQYDKITMNGNIRSFAAGRECYQVKSRAEYGPGAVSTIVTQVRQGNFWTDKPVDDSVKRELQHQLNEAIGELHELKQENIRLLGLMDALRAEVAKMREEVEQVRAQKNELQREHSIWQALPDKIESEKRSEQDKRQELVEAQRQMADLQKQHDRAVLEKAEAVLQHQAKLSNIREAYQALQEAKVLLIEAQSDFEVLKEKNAEIIKNLEDEKKALAEISKQMAQIRQRAIDAKAAAEDALSEEERSEGEFSALAKATTLEQVESDLRTQENLAEGIEANNPHALREYQDWAQKIERQKAIHDRCTAQLADVNAKIETIRSQWEPRLDELVSRINDAFSYNFEQISCAGEVGVHKDEDFDKWAIEIKVRFRAGEALQRLDQHRQSGGERAVSTIFYLMSLQSMAQAPFRVVDEINQGMDPRNERMVHERMVEIACREHTSQYFLITPKLLSGLRYDKRMRVHTIISGEHVDPEGTIKMNFSKFAEIQRGLSNRTIPFASQMVREESSQASSMVEASQA
ncbi:P-loop containing nucleoside triphosphate hydrolase protein [Pseudoneurospora amorphoporcata]|uniref:Structural maintenance of chromosomes protein 5 n=1 Tax=Pseudoneurospora amorphoporcata TaxID=241081 RepID=A0AAN6P2U6_9PEZI|nr:P-loop containing nucleoside triphosphate hydrolase protein [Pseudoneurospora amorphoporcata]